mmetsp:Transcript_21128/g.3437  ORF Transcript_21128/g.3437 Transcript_21128/m.3437 type:complete len:122 (+) Transcript_21128:2572-2937(+)
MLCGALFKGMITSGFASGFIIILSINFIVGSRRVDTGDISREDFVIAFFVICIAAWSYFILAPILSDAVLAVASISHLAEIFKQAPKINTKDNNGRKEGIQGSIEFKNVHFQYPSRKMPVL